MVRTLLPGLLALPLALGFLSPWWPPGDSLAVLRIPLALALLGLLPMATRRLRRPLLLMALLAVVPPLSGRLAPENPGPITLYQKNLLFANRTLGQVADDILAKGPDVITLQEVSTRATGFLQQLAQAYPHQHLCPFNGWNGIAVLSRHPILDRQCTGRRNFAAAHIAHPDGPIWIVSLHFDWPWPHGQAATARSAAARLERLQDPRIIAGDFNMVPWGHSVRMTARAAGLSVVGPHAATWKYRGQSLLPIDHVLAASGRVTRLGYDGSDHTGLWAQVTPGAAPGTTLATRANPKNK